MALGLAASKGTISGPGRTASQIRVLLDGSKGPSPYTPAILIC
ncbi:hypothetical protein ACVWZ6_007040 [Bradyrhizobium sp. GM6.1]